MSAEVQERDGRHARWDDHREQRRRLIIDAAIAVVEESPPGSGLRLQDVAARVGLVRTVVQRHFGGQTGLMRDVQAEVLRRAFAHIAVPIRREDSMISFLTRVVHATIEWVGGNLALHALIEHEVGDGEPSELSRVIAAYADHLAGIGTDAAEALGVSLRAAEVDELRMLFIGFVAQVRGTVTAWSLERPQRLTPARLEELQVGWITSQLSAQFTALGVGLDLGAPLGLATVHAFDPGAGRAGVE